MEYLPKIPRFGWKARLDTVFPQRRSQNLRPKFKQILPMIPLFIRYLIYSIKMWIKGKKPIMDFIFPAKNDERSGVPLGGIGGGTIGRGFRGEFCNFQIIPGIYENGAVLANQFIVNIQNGNNETIYQKVLTVVKQPPKSELNSWDWTFSGKNAEYTALYPRSWTSYNIPEHDISLVCHQISPVIPKNYKDSCMPVTVFEWYIINKGESSKNVSITFTMKNGIGARVDREAPIQSRLFEKDSGNFKIEGVTLSQKIGDLPYSYSIGLELKEPEVFVSRCLYFNPKENGEEIWTCLKKTGHLNSESSPYYNTKKKEELAFAVCGKVNVLQGASKKLAFSFSWDIPKIFFPGSNIQHIRYYTKYFGDSGNAGPDLCLYALENYKKWELEIQNWQEKYLVDDNLPDWYKSALLNELYYISDGGTLWLVPNDLEMLAKDDPRAEYGRFAYLEGHEYRMYNTYDVHFYASFALTMLWPGLQMSLQYDIRDSIEKCDDTTVCYLYNGQMAYRKTKDTVPHDVGDPEDAPWLMLNAYNIHDVAEWRDLNLKFVLQVYRDYSLHKSFKYLEDMYPAVIAVMNYALKWDSDNDGMIENSGSPDQTYDAWTMTETSAYCGGLWVASLFAAADMAKYIEDIVSFEKFSSLLTKAKSAYETKLWNGSYYNFDSSGSHHSISIMSDQLCGLWYLRCCFILEEIFPKNNVKSALNTIYNHNVRCYYNGKQGAVNGMMPTGEVDDYAIQSEEVWTGVTYALGSLMIWEDLLEQGFSTARGIYETVYVKSGLGFATPEALHGLNSFRSLSYMRPLSIWSMQLAIENKCFKSSNSERAID